MFDRIQTYTIEEYLVMVPLCPMVQLFPDVWVLMVDVIVHQIIIITFFITDHIFPRLAMLINDSVDGFFLVNSKIYG